MNTLEIQSYSEDFSLKEDISEIPVIDYEDLEYDDFFKMIMMRNIPCIIKNVNTKWEASKNWVYDNTINYEYFISNYGELEAPVADCNKINFNAQCKTSMKIKDFMKYLKTERKQQLLYLKDWHLKAKLKDDNLLNNFYDVPQCFASDWLNEYAEDKQEDDFKFVYIGSSDTWTPLHADVYTSFSWSVNVVGKKKWILFSPGEEEKLKNSLGNLPLLFDSGRYGNIAYFEVTQERGDALFVPSGWYHQVHNMCDTISINHNFINACNIEKVWVALQNNLSEVEKEISEFKESPEFLNQCQLILKSLFGMDFDLFLNFIIHIAKKRIKEVQGTDFTVFNKYFFGINHIKFDLQALFKVLKLLEAHPLFTKNIISPDLISHHNDIIKKISKIIE